MNKRSFILRDEFVKKYFEGNILPFSFCVSGRKAKVNIVSSMKNRTDANATTLFLLGKCSVFDVKTLVTIYDSHAAVDWKVEITNNSSKNSPFISKGYGTDIEFDESGANLWHSTGDYVSADGLDQTIDPLKNCIKMESNGRPCDGAFPYYRLLFKDWAIDGAVGWQGKWAGTFSEKSGKVSVKAGQAILNSYLKPGETFKLSSSTLLFADGGNKEAINDWRSFYFDCIIPKPNGERIKPMSTGTSFDSALEFCFSNEKTNIQCMETYKQNGIQTDLWWIDAGWYDYNIGDTAKDWVRTGTWEYDKERFPNSLLPISENAHKNGMKFLLWLEPERVHIGTKLFKEHHDLLLTSPKDIYCALLNLGDPACVEYISNHVNKLIKDNGIDVYRQDFNFDPNLFWRENETEDRQGALENHHCQGYLQYWDNLLAENPGLWIDSCASGGRRNDIETMKRSVPLHYSDFGYGDLPVKDAFQQTMFEWLPYFKEQPMSWTEANEDFQHLDALSPFYSIGTDIWKIYPKKQNADKDGNPFILHEEEMDTDALANTLKYFDVWKVFAKYCYGNYYQFTKQSKTFDKWSVLQFTCPKCGNGVIKALRFKDNAQECFTFSPEEIDFDAQYELRNVITDEVAVIPGKMLGKNFTITLEPGCGVMYEYVKL